MKMSPLHVISTCLKSIEIKLQKSDMDSGLNLSWLIRDLRDSRFPGLPDEYLPPLIKINPDEPTEGYAEVRKTGKQNGD